MAVMLSVDVYDHTRNACYLCYKALLTLLLVRALSSTRRFPLANLRNSAGPQVTTLTAMSALRLASSLSRRAPRALAAARRGYAEAVSDKIKLSLVLPHQARNIGRELCALYLYALQSIFSSTDVVQVNIPAATGDMGILANHVPSIEALRPGVVEVIESGNASKKFFGKSYHKRNTAMIDRMLYSLRRICYCPPQ